MSRLVVLLLRAGTLLGTEVSHGVQRVANPAVTALGDGALTE